MKEPPFDGVRVQRLNGWVLKREIYLLILMYLRNVKVIYPFLKQASSLQQPILFKIGSIFNEQLYCKIYHLPNHINKPPQL